MNISELNLPKKSIDFLLEQGIQNFIHHKKMPSRLDYLMIKKVS